MNFHHHDSCQVWATLVPAILLILGLAALVLVSLPPGDAAWELRVKTWMQRWLTVAFGMIAVLLLGAIAHSWNQPAQRAAAQAVPGESAP